MMKPKYYRVIGLMDFLSHYSATVTTSTLPTCTKIDSNPQSLNVSTPTSKKAVLLVLRTSNQQHKVALKIMEIKFAKEELAASNCSGTYGQEKLDQTWLGLIKSKCVINFWIAQYYDQAEVHNSRSLHLWPLFNSLIANSLKLKLKVLAKMAYCTSEECWSRPHVISPLLSHKVSSKNRFLAKDITHAPVLEVPTRNYSSLNKVQSLFESLI